MSDLKTYQKNDVYCTIYADFELVPPYWHGLPVVDTEPVRYRVNPEAMAAFEQSALTGRILDYAEATDCVIVHDGAVCSARISELFAFLDAAFRDGRMHPESAIKWLKAGRLEETEREIRERYATERIASERETLALLDMGTTSSAVALKHEEAKRQAVGNYGWPLKAAAVWEEAKLEALYRYAKEAQDRAFPRDEVRPDPYAAHREREAKHLAAHKADLDRPYASRFKADIVPGPRLSGLPHPWECDE